MTVKPDPDDGWGDLARELGLEPPPSRLPSHTAPPAEPDTGAEPDSDPLFSATDGQPDLFQDFEPNGDAEPDDGMDESAEGDSDGEPTGEPDDEEPKKKKRRRRRRKKRNGDAPDAGALPVEAVDSDDESEGETDDEGEAGDDSDETAPATEAARELVANWDVPSWEQIVAGLYRPGAGGR